MQYQTETIRQYLLALTICLLYGLERVEAQQQLPIRDFVIFGGAKNCPPGTPFPGCGVVLNSSSALFNGAVGSHHLVSSTGPVTINSNIYSGGRVVLANSNTVNANISAANGSGAANTVQIGSNAQINGNMEVVGHTTVVSGTVNGTVNYLDGGSYTGPDPRGGAFEKIFLPPQLPTLPKPADMWGSGSRDVLAGGSIDTGVYRDMKLNGGQVLRFSRPGRYVFRSIGNSGNVNRFVFDFKENPSGVFLIYVQDNANVAKLNVELVNGGSPGQVYAETQGRGAGLGGYAWVMSNGASGGNRSQWLGTIYAPYAGIRIGSGTSDAKVSGALWSATQVLVESGVSIDYAPFTCPVPTANAGADQVIGCAIKSVTLTGSSTTANVSYQWAALGDGVISGETNKASITATAPGTYVLYVTSTECGAVGTDTVELAPLQPCIDPLYDPVGKINDPIGPELTALAKSPETVQDPETTIFQLTPGRVRIEVIAQKDKASAVYELLTKPEYGLSDTVFNGSQSLVITGSFPIANLPKLNQLPTLINFVRPLFPGVGNGGLVVTAGDTAMRSHFVREGYKLDGRGVKVGVLSDSYNSKQGDPASVDVANEDLPGPGNPFNTTGVQVLEDLPVGAGTDEGRAMLQIIHDIAPGASLAFRTGVRSAGDMALGIRQLAAAGCQLVVDDISHITEPFFSDGQIARAVNDVSLAGVSYFTAAGNFGNRSYAGVFNPAAPPAGMNGQAHNFGGGDILQKVLLKKGVYTLVLQWQDAFFSQAQTGIGAGTDLDIYLADNSGRIIYGFNRNNLRGDPVEIMPFEVDTDVEVNLLIIRASGTAAVPFKYIFFRGEGTVLEHAQNSSTIVGQANATGAITVGAVLYTNTPPYGVNPPTIASFSSIGGKPVDGQVRSKPDLAAPNGGNTTVNLGAPNIDGDRFFNFFGTSAAAPHAAGAAALLVEARRKFFNSNPTPEQVRQLLRSSALDMGITGDDFSSGSGFIQPYLSIFSFAAPTPQINTVRMENAAIRPGSEEATIVIEGNFLTNNTQVLFRGTPLPTTVLNSTTATALLPAFGTAANPPIQLRTTAVTPSGLDGGTSEPFYFFTPEKQKVRVVANDKTKLYGEQMPGFTASVYVNGQLVDPLSPTIGQLGLNTLSFTSTGQVSSNVNKYRIRPVRIFSNSLPADIGLLEVNEYSFVDGVLDVLPLPITVSPRDTTVVYGEKITDFNFNYQPDTAVVLVGSALLFDTLQQQHKSLIIKDALLLTSRVMVNGKILDEATFNNLAMLASSRVMVNGSRVMVNTSRVMVNGVTETTKVVDLVPEIFEAYRINPDTATLNSSRVMVNAAALNSSRVMVNGRVIVNGSRVMVNSSTVDSSSSNVAVVIDETDVNAPEGDSLTGILPVNLVTGLTSGTHLMLPGAVLNGNFKIKYRVGALTILPAPLTVTVSNADANYGKPPVLEAKVSGFRYDDKAATVLAGQPQFVVRNSLQQVVPLSQIAAGSYQVTASYNLVAPANYFINPIAGTLTINKVPLEVAADTIIVAQGTLPVNFTATIRGWQYSDAQTVVPGTPIFNTSPKYTGAAGVYEIQPDGLQSPKLDNYMVAYKNGRLYVNPFGPGTKKVKTILECVEVVRNHPSGFGFIARFAYQNDNATTVVVLRGNENQIVAEGSFSGQPPEFFEPGYGRFAIPFDGKKITWNLVTVDVNQKTASASEASSTSTRCKSRNAIDPIETTPTLDDMTIAIFPNPARDVLFVNGVKPAPNLRFQVVAANGQAQNIKPIGNASNLRLNISGLAAGVYFLRIETGTQVIRRRFVVLPR